MDDYFAAANDETMLIVLIEDIIAVRNLDEILEVDHIDVFFVAPSDLAASMGNIADQKNAEVQKTIDGALSKIVAAGKNAGTLVLDETVERYAKLGVRCLFAPAAQWLSKGARNFKAQVQEILS